MKDLNLICDVCRSEPAVGVAASPLAPMSQAYGRECLRQEAEPLWLVHATIDLCGGPEHINEWVKEIRSYKDGRYIEWDEIIACYVPDPEVML